VTSPCCFRWGQGENDSLVSFSAGLTVTSLTEGGISLGSRAAWQKFDLEPGETREFAVTVRADQALNAAPLHITELYRGGRVFEQIDGVFLRSAVGKRNMSSSPASSDKRPPLTRLRRLSSMAAAGVFP